MNTLAGLPLDVGTYLSHFLDDRSVAVMHRVCKATYRSTLPRLVALSNRIPSTGEVLAYLRDQVTVNMPTQVTLLTPRDQPSAPHSTLELRAGQYYLARVRDPEIVLAGAHAETLPVREGALRDILGPLLVDPSTLLLVMGRRVGPTRLHPRGRAYGSDVVRAYTSDVLRPLLEPLVGSELATTLLTGRTASLSVPVPQLPRVEFDRKVERLRDTLHGWIYQRGYERVTPTRTDGEVAATYRLCLQSVLRGDILPADHIRKRLSEVEPTTSQVLDYVLCELRAGRPVRATFYAEVGSTPMRGWVPVAEAAGSVQTGGIGVEEDPFDAEVTSRVYVLDMEDLGCGTYTEYTVGFSSTRTRVLSGPETLTKLLKERRLPGILSPALARKVSLWNCRRASNVELEARWNSYEWQSYLQPPIEYLGDVFGIAPDSLLIRMTPAELTMQIRRVYSSENVTWRVALYHLWCTGDATTFYESLHRLGNDERKDVNVACVQSVLDASRRLSRYYTAP
jgi:hypothetical protein